MKYFLGINKECNTAGNFGQMFLTKEDNTIEISEKDAKAIFIIFGLNDFTNYEQAIEEIFENENFVPIINQIISKY